MRPPGGSRPALLGSAVAAAGLLAGVVAAAVLPELALPVVVDLRGLGGAGARVGLGEVAGRIALLVPAALAVVLLVLLRRRGGPRLRCLLPVGASAPIGLFLVAQLNGVRDVGALVLVYATTAGAVLIRSVPGRRPWSVAAMLGIVPWGVVALHQVGALLLGGGAAVPAGVRVLTLAVLVATTAEFVRDRRVAGGAAPAPVLVALPPALLAAGSLLIG